MYPRLTTEEFQAFLQKKRDFFDFYGIKTVPLYRQVAAGLHQLAAFKQAGLYGKKRNAQEATAHYLKACLYNPEYLTYKATREAL
jgi:hypothetical protein